MNKVVINPHWGGFSVSTEFVDRYRAARGDACPDTGIHGYKIPRHDPLLVEWVESLHAIGKGQSFKIVEIDGDRYQIEENEDGAEYVMTPDNIPWFVIGS